MKLIPPKKVLLQFQFLPSEKKHFKTYFAAAAIMSLGGGAEYECLAKLRTGGVGVGKIVGSELLIRGGKLK